MIHRAQQADTGTDLATHLGIHPLRAVVLLVELKQRGEIDPAAQAETPAPPAPHEEARAGRDALLPLLGIAAMTVILLIAVAFYGG